MGVGEAGEFREEVQKEKEVNGYLLDTHVWIWIIQAAAENISANFFAEVESWQRQRLSYLSPYACWEMSLLLEADQLELDEPLAEIWRRDTDSDAFRIADLSAEILIESNRLPGELHRDPADRIFAATARMMDLTLVTRDKRLLAYAKQGHLKARKP